jgi:glycosyltransferase involved in cell wall biosynthesis
MRIAQISTLSAPVCEESNGSVESFVWLLTRELIRLGHEVTVFGTADSDAPGKLVSTQPGAYGSNGAIDDWHLCEWLNIAGAVERSDQFDVLHSHAYLWGLPLSRISNAPMVHTTHIVPDEDAAKLRGLYPDAHVTGISQQQWSAFPHLKPEAVIHHGIDGAKFTLNENPDDYVCYLGRFVSGKGPRHAIATARSLGVRLLMAGPPNSYFKEQVQPLIDGRSVEYVGFVRGAERDKLLGGARALLYPIQHPESFGLVLLEAMLCGTPVAARRLGAVPELVDEGITGYSVTALEELGNAVTKCLSLDRREVRRRAEARFSVQVMARQYERLYERVVSSARAKA